MQTSKFFRSLMASTLALGVSASGMSEAHDFKIGEIQVGHPAAPASLPGQTSAVVYLTIENRGRTADRLVALESPAAQNVVVHRMTMNGPVMAMREVDDLPLEPLKQIALTAGANYHIMMTGLKQPLVINEKIPLMLTFAQAGKLQVTVNVEPSAADKAAGMEMGSVPGKTADQKAAPHHH